MTSTTDPAGAREAGTPDEATTQVSRDGRREPRLPHEHDTSSDSGRGAPTPEMKQAGRDLAAGRQPTDRSAEADEVYRRTLRGR